jgi:hypothetical protein
MEKAVHSAKRGSFQLDLRTTKSLKQDEAGLRLILERRLALICWMERELQRRKRQIMKDKEQLLEQPLLELRMCPKCFRFASLSHTQVDTRKNQFVRVYECQCGEQFTDG